MNVGTTSPVANYGSGDGQGRCQIVAGSADAPLFGVAATGLWWLALNSRDTSYLMTDADNDSNRRRP